MSKGPESDPKAEPAQPSAPTQAAGQQQGQQVQVEDSHAVTSYANFCRVTGSPEELIIDFGLNSQPMGVPQQPIVINQRIIVNFFTAKRLLAALHMSVQRHEAAFGVLETDVQKRLQPSARQQAGALRPSRNAWVVREEGVEFLTPSEAVGFWSAVAR